MALIIDGPHTTLSSGPYSPTIDYNGLISISNGAHTGELQFTIERNKVRAMTSSPVADL